MVTLTYVPIKSQVLDIVTQDWRKAKRPRCFSEIEMLWTLKHGQYPDPGVLATALRELEEDGSLVYGETGEKLVHVPTEARIGDLSRPFSWYAPCGAKGEVR